MVFGVVCVMVCSIVFRMVPVCSIVSSMVCSMVYTTVCSMMYSIT